MTEKDLDSMATVQMKQEYAPSEVYSTTSEPPPAYKRRSNSVQIAKIVAFTIIVSSFVIGSFILASTYLQARASCDQMQALDSVLEKELMLETLQQELPRAEALLGKENEEMDLQSIDREEPVKKEDKSEQEATPIENESETDSSFSDSDESDDLQKNHFKVPLELDLSDLAAALLENNQKSRMNCVIERKHAEELVDSPARSMQLPFGVNLTTDPKKQRITGERISISCDSGSDNDDKRSNEDSEQVRPIFFPFQRMPIPFGAQPQQVPLTHMPQQMSSQPMMHQIPPPFQQMPMRPQIPPQFMQAPHPEPQVRIQVQRIPIREFQIPQEIQEQLMGNRNEMNQQQMPQIQVQRVPLGLALQRAGITPDDLRNIQRMAEERITEELRHLAAEESASNSETADSSEQQDDSQSNEESMPTQQPAEPQLSLHPPMQEPQMLQMGRGAYGRSLATPVRIPVQMMQPQDMSNDNSESERPHYVQPRSVRSVENTFLHREKRVKRCACDCSC